MVRIFTHGELRELSEDEYVMGTSYLTALFRNFENFYYQHETGAMEDHLWSGMLHSMIGYYYLPNINDWWQQRKVIYSPNFVEFLESQSRQEEFELPMFKHQDV